MATHRYWSLEVRSRPGTGNAASIAEIEMRGSVGGADQCVGGTPSGASSAGQVIANAFDDNNGTQWYNGGVTDWLRLSYDFGAPVDVAEIKVRAPGAGAYSGFAPLVCRVGFSDDGTTWKVGSRLLDTSNLGDGEEALFAGVGDTQPVGVVSDLGLASIEFARAWPATLVTVSGQPFVILDVYHGGFGKIVGTVKATGAPDYPVQRRVRLFRDKDGICLGEVWSDPVTGDYQFVGIDPTQRYTVLAYDYEGIFRAVVADNLTPEVYP